MKQNLPYSISINKEEKRKNDLFLLSLYLQDNKILRLDRLFAICQENNYQKASTKHLTFLCTYN